MWPGLGPAGSLKATEPPPQNTPSDLTGSPTGSVPDSECHFPGAGASLDSACSWQDSVTGGEISPSQGELGLPG